MSDTRKDPAEPFDSATGTNPEPTTDSSVDALHKSEDSPDTSDENAHADVEQMQEKQQDKAEQLKDAGIGQSGETSSGAASSE
jgi:hypothetical protein